MARLSAVRSALTAWLSRPLASFHLVLALCGLLTLIGIVMVLSASSPASGAGGQVYALFGRHLMFVAIGAAAFLVALRCPLRLLRQVAPVLLVASVAMLAMVLSPLGTSVFGAQRSFALGPIYVQPVELAKLALALWGAHILVSKSSLLHQWRHLLVPIVPVALVMFALVIAQPDLGSTVSLGVVLLALLWFAGAPKLLFILVSGVAALAVGVLAVIAPYRLARVMTFLDLEADPQGTGWQARQAMFALADGGLFGAGLGQGASKWQYLPSVHNDFIFALIGEELGLIGACVVIGLFAAVAVVGLRIAARNLDPWIRIVAGTLTVWIVGQAGINIGYVVGLLPITGIPLPMISYGGTSLVVTMFSFGVLANCARHEPEAVAALRNQGPGKFGKLLRLPAPDPYRPKANRTAARSKSRGGGRPAGRDAGGGQRPSSATQAHRAPPKQRRGQRRGQRGGRR
ncbi:putative lipid II flippase FtsW [Haloechinothrix sp. LS1_15]|uniref:putative lipid II flippase FtsW n=1 Tax=Haloechinothrix sp. LS1_15 TaxID=2652248 RepID=UPI00294491EB|nr:putative lipid II flippase FtsW [Haloechinothrix sp. LS1_15]MDV6013474.1 putative lipid II flippase FtsW [Haloechinothrix sp. LS1_15]